MRQYPLTAPQTVRATNAGEKQAQLRAKNIVVSEKDGHLRAAVHFYNSEDDLSRFLDALQAA